MDGSVPMDRQSNLRKPMTELEAKAIEAALTSAHGRVVSPSKHKWPDGYVNEDYPYEPYWTVLTDSLETRLELYKKRNQPDENGQMNLGNYE